MKNYKEYINKYLNLHSQTCSKPEDYDRISVAKHNKAIVKLNAFQDEICKDQDLAEKVFSELLQNEDITVLLGAAACCVNHNILIEDAEKTLEWIVQTGDYWITGIAERVLGVWCGEIDPDKPW